MGGKKKRKDGGGFRFSDFLIILLCLTGAAYSVNLFRIDLFSTIASRDAQPVGTITIRNNTVQRRIADRVLWDRLFVKSPVYLGDLIRVAEHSSATLSIEGSDINLEENTLIRILLSESGDGSFQIELSEGSLSLARGEDGGNITLNLQGRTVELAAGTVLYAEAGEDGIHLQVNEGAAAFIDDESRRELFSGTMIAIDSSGTERMERAAVVMLPGPNARYLKTAPVPLIVDFTWNRINLDEDETLILEIAEDVNFSRIAYSMSGLYEGARAAFDTGLWHWRLSYDAETLSKGQLAVADGTGPALTSPAAGSLYRYQENSPLRFQWAEVENADAYLFEVSQTQLFLNPAIAKRTEAAFLVDSGLEPGTWYWRVMPVFPAAYEGTASFSEVSFFRLERNSEEEAGNQVMIGAVAGPEPEPVLPVAAEEESAPEPDEAPVPEPAPAVQPPPPPAPLPPFPAPRNLAPEAGTRIGLPELRDSRSIVFSWDAVEGANAYIFTLYEETAEGRRQLIQNPAENRTSWTLYDIGAIGRGTFAWQAEAVLVNGAIIERRGAAAEGSFIIDIPSPGPVMLNPPGILYGN